MITKRKLNRLDEQSNDILVKAAELLLNKADVPHPSGWVRGTTHKVKYDYVTAPDTDGLVFMAVDTYCAVGAINHAGMGNPQVGSADVDDATRVAYAKLAGLVKSIYSDIQPVRDLNDVRHIVKGKAPSTQAQIAWTAITNWNDNKVKGLDDVVEKMYEAAGVKLQEQGSSEPPKTSLVK